MSSLPPSTPSSPSPGNLTFHISPVGPIGKVYVDFQGRTYELHVFDNANDEITTKRDWTDIAKDVLKVLKTLEEKQKTDASLSNEQKFSLAKAKTTQVVIGEHAPSLIQKISWDDKVSDRPSKDIRIEENTLQDCQDIMSKLGEHLHDERPYTPTPQRPVAEAPSVQTPPETPPAQPAVSLPSLDRLRPSKNTESIQAKTFAASLKGISTTSYSDPFAALLNQFKQFNPSLTEQELKKQVATFISNHAGKLEPGEYQEMIDLFAPLAGDVSKVEAFKKSIRGLVDIPAKDVDALVAWLANNGAPLNQKMKTLSAQAFANYIQNKPAIDFHSPLIFRAAQAWIDTKERLLRSSTSNNIGLVVVTKNPAGDYILAQKHSKEDLINPSRTAFVYYDESNKQYASFDRSKLNLMLKDPSSLPKALPKGNPVPGYYSNKLEFNGVENALADALMQQEKQYYSNENDWKIAQEAAGLEIRQEILMYTFDNPEELLNVSNDIIKFLALNRDEIYTALNSNPEALKQFKNLIQPLTLKATFLSDQKIEPADLDKITKEQKNWLIKLYAAVIPTDKNLNNHSFLTAFAKSTGKKIAVITKKDGVEKIAEAFPSSQLIKKSDYLFVYWNNASRKFENVNPNNPALDNLITGYNSNVAP